jgi:hypothetical protein
VATPTSTTSISLSWVDQSDNEDGFRIERALWATPTFVEVGTVTADVTSFLDAAVLPDSVYRYRVRAYNTAGLSEYSTSVAAIAAIDRAPEDVYLVWKPRVIHPGDDSVELTVFLPAWLTEVRLAPVSAPVVTLTRLSPYRWTIKLSVTKVLAGYTAGDAHQFVGYLDLYEGETSWRRGNLFVNVRDAGTMPAVVVTSIAADLQVSPHVVNLRFDSLFLGFVPREVPQRFYQSFPDAFDFLAVVEQVESFNNRSYMGVQNDIAGLGLQPLDFTAFYGSGGRLQGIIDYPIASFFDLGEKGTNHEIGHRWINYLSHSALVAGSPHWPIGELAYGIMGFSIPPTGQGGDFPFQFEAQGNGDYRLRCVGSSQAYNDFELYLMGLMPKDSVRPQLVFTDQNQGPIDCNQILHGPLQTITIDDVIAADGERPAASQRDFTMATLVLSAGRLLTQEEMAFFDHMAARGEARVELPFTLGFSRGMTKPFYLATGGRATLTTRVQ